MIPLESLKPPVNLKTCEIKLGLLLRSCDFVSSYMDRDIVVSAIVVEIVVQRVLDKRISASQIGQLGQTLLCNLTFREFNLKK